MPDRREPPNSELAAQVAALHPIVQALELDNERLNARITALEQRDVVPPPPVEWIALKAALPPGVIYETARAWCERGFVTAHKQGGRWFVDPESLGTAIALRRSRAT